MQLKTILLILNIPWLYKYIIQSEILWIILKVQQKILQKGSAVFYKACLYFLKYQNLLLSIIAMFRYHLLILNVLNTHLNYKYIWLYHNYVQEYFFHIQTPATNRLYYGSSVLNVLNIEKSIWECEQIDIFSKFTLELKAYHSL